MAECILSTYIAALKQHYGIMDKLDIGKSYNNFNKSFTSTFCKHHSIIAQ